MNLHVMKIIESLENGEITVDDAVSSIDNLRNIETRSKKRNKIRKLKVVIEQVDGVQIKKIWVPSIPLWLCKAFSKKVVRKINQKSHSNNNNLDITQENDFILDKKIIHNFINELKKYEPFVLIVVDCDDSKILIKAC